MAITKSIARLARDRRGANMVEYIILVGVVALFALLAFKNFGGEVSKRVDAETKAVGEIYE